VHRWFRYKEGFSPALLSAVLDELGITEQVRVADVFGGVGTTGLSGLVEPRVREVRSVEYSPFARFAGRTKLAWPTLSPQRLGRLLPAALAYDRFRPVDVPELAAFSNRDIFSPNRIRTLLAARDHLRELDDASEDERAVLLLGLAAVIEDLAGAMKDGRALRIKRGRSRRASSLAETPPLVDARGVVKRALAGQWTAMIHDLRALAAHRAQALETPTHHLAGDARMLSSIRLDRDQVAFPDGWAGLSLFSPPYLNFIDYTELYKLELWLMEYVIDQAAFREMRLGTLRSHPSVRFPERTYFENTAHVAIELVLGLSEWVAARGTRQEVAPVIRQYFEDMLEVWREQLRIVASGASAVCVVANSTFSRRQNDSRAGHHELWRLPVLTDVILAHLALVAGFKDVRIIEARQLRPRNVQGGRARESLVVATAP
jgi:hypothetical protein